MSEFKFKTTINCGNCVNLVRPDLDGEPEIERWEVDTQNPDKVLTVSGQDITRERVMSVVRDAGFEIEPLS